MSSIFVLILISFFTGLAAWFAFLWAVKSGHFDDIEGPKYRMFDDDKDKVKEMDKDEDRDEKKEKNKDKKKNKNKHESNDEDKEACGS